MSLICLVGRNGPDVQLAAEQMDCELMTLSHRYPTDVPGAVRHLRAHGHAIWTSNPLVLDEFAPEDAYLVCRDRDHALIVTRFADMPSIRERLAVYTLGALWVSYADWLYEEPLRLGLPRPGREKDG